MYGVVNLSLAALRREPFERSEMLNQLLFGETFTILEAHRDWLRVSLSLDSYEGWIDTKVCKSIDQQQMNLLTLNDVAKVSTRLFKAQSANSEFPIRLCPGSTIYNYDSSNGKFWLAGEEYKTFNVPFEILSEDKKETLVSLAVEYVNAPYLWGGRSPYGIDCSGLIQVLFKMIGMTIPRDASQQVTLGEIVEFSNLAKPGDLAFFDDEDGNIIHVGMILPDGKIIHSSGSVKIDPFDHQGIYSAKEKNYSHKLRVIKNLLD